MPGHESCGTAIGRRASPSPGNDPDYGRAVAELTFDIRYDERRSRLTNAFRGILAIPHIIVLTVWGYFAEILAFIQWFIVLFTGQRNQALWDLQYGYMGYSGRVNGYVNLMFDPYPPFGTAQGDAPAVMALAYEEPASRLTNGLRFIWAIPALVISFFVGIAFAVVILISWFAIVITGAQPAGPVRLQPPCAAVHRCRSTPTCC